MIVSHRDLDILLEANRKGEKFYIYTGRGPSSGSLHIGHLIPFLTAKYLQDIFDVPVYIQLSTDEKYLRDNLTLSNVESMARSNAADIMSLGFNPNKTIILSNFEAIKQLYPTTMNILRHTTLKQMMGIFGVNDGDNAGNYYFPAVEAAPAFPSSLKGIIDNHPRCLVVLGLDQDPYFRMARDVAHCLGEHKPALIHTSFVPGLRSIESKMSSSDPNFAIFLSDVHREISDKIKRHAFSGGKVTADEQRILGADISIDVSCKYLEIFGSFKEFTPTADIQVTLNNYASGRILTGDIKQIIIDLLYSMVKLYRQNRIKEDVLDEVMRIRNISS